LLSRAKYLTIRASCSLDAAAGLNRREEIIGGWKHGIDSLRGHPGLKRLSTLPSAAGGISRHACASLREAGIELAPLLAKAGLTNQQIEDRSARLKVQSQIKLLDLAATALQDDFLGFHLARDFDLREIGLLYYVLASSERLRLPMKAFRCACVMEKIFQ
jgi:hypothetical protein